MADHGVAANPEATILGVKLTMLIAGFAGGVVTLSFLRELDKTQSVLAVFTGMVTAAYGTPVVSYYLGLPQAVELGAAFFVGITAMNIIPGAIKLSEIFRKNPERFIGKNREDDK